jgi:hypothetical protein
VGKPVTRAKSRASKATVSKKPIRKNQAVVRSFSASRWWPSSTQMKVLLLVVVLAFGTLGVMKLRDSNAATYNLSKSNCIMLGRVYQSDGLCASACVSGAGSYITSGVTWAYCSNALSTGVSSSKCYDLRRTYLLSQGCARRWIRTNMTSQLQCRALSDRYIVVTSGYDYCAAYGSTAFNNSVNGGVGTTSGSTSTTSSSWVAPIAASMGNGYHTGHWAVDFPAPTGTAVKAVNSGTITYNGYIAAGCGYGVILKTTLPNSTQTVYIAYQHINNRASGSVSKGQTIGTVAYVGVSSCWTGTHLHFGFQQVSSYFVNPGNYDNTYLGSPCNYLPNC